MSDLVTLNSSWVSHECSCDLYGLGFCQDQIAGIALTKAIALTKENRAVQNNVLLFL